MSLLTVFCLLSYYETNSFYVTKGLYSNRSQEKSKYGKIKKVTHKVQPHFYIFCDLVLNRTIEHKWITVLLSSSDVSVPDSTEFQSLKEFVSEKTLNAITDMGFTNMMEIQHKSIVPLLKGRYSMIPMFGV